VIDDISRSPTPSRTGGALLRVAWMAAVPFALVCVLLLISERATQTLGAYDVVLAVLVLLAIVARAVDALRFQGTTARGEPSTRSHVIGYVARLVPIIAVAWLLARTVAP
jgi:hypothetical protein